MEIDNSRKALGRGLGALIPGAASPVQTAAQARGLQELSVSDIHANKYQPRKTFDEEALEELTASIREKGILQPVVVRKAGPDKFELIAGERRWRAAKKAGLTTIPALVKDVSDLESLELALIENIQRRDLNPIEEAQSYASLVGEFKLTQEDLAKRVGRERSTVANMLRLLKLPDAIQKDLAGGVLSMGHARALLALSDHASQMQVRAEVIAKQLSVRATEALVARWRPIAGKKKAESSKPAMDIEMKKATEDLKRRIGAKVGFKGSSRRGKIEIEYGSLDELNRILAVLLDR
jgi:ParB family chromosome partitioning protein